GESPEPRGSGTVSLCEAQAVTRSAPLKRTRAETVARAHTLGTRSGWKSESTGTGTVVEDRTLARPGGEPLVPAGRGAGRRRGSRQAPPSRRFDRLRLGGWGSGCGAWRPAPVNPSEVRSDVRRRSLRTRVSEGKGAQKSAGHWISSYLKFGLSAISNQSTNQ